MSLRLVKAAADSENSDDLHLARLLLLLGSADARKKTTINKARAVEGITKLAKMDFLLRYGARKSPCSAEASLEFHLTSLVLAFKKETVAIPFGEVSYFWGQMGAGKTSIARLIDYCLGGSIELSPALQNEFVSATLKLKLRKGRT